MCSGEGTETFEEWLARMNATGTRVLKRSVDWVADGHGHLLDPQKDELDDVAKRRVAERAR